MVRKKKVSFWAIKKVSVPVRVRFRDKFGRPVSFRAVKRIPTPVKVTFYTKKRRRKW